MEYFGTIGPACDREDILRQMFVAGMTGIRMNMSHGNLAEHQDWVELLHRAAAEAGRPLKLLIDLQGPELRIGKLPGPVELTDGSEVLLGKGVISIPETIYDYVQRGSSLLLDDGKILLEVLENRRLPQLRGEAGRHPAVRREHRRAGQHPSSPHTDRIRFGKNLSLAAACGVSGVMLPFVRDVQDLVALRQALTDAGQSTVRIYAKLENRQGIASLPELLDYADVFVIARGDLGNDVPLWELPAVQKRTAAFFAGGRKAIVIVTQMLDSMERRPVPTRAEVCDIFNAVLDGADAVMLTGETAAGKYPVQAMEYLVKTGEAAVKYLKEPV